MKRRGLNVYVYRVYQRSPDSFLTTMDSCIVVAANEVKAEASLKNNVENLLEIEFSERVPLYKKSVRSIGIPSIITSSG